MFQDLLPMTLSQGARHIGVEPLEIVRLMVFSDTVTPTLRVTRAQLENLARAGGVETGWWNDVEVPADDIAPRAIVRAALGLLCARAASGDPVRMDNLWRGRSLEEQDLIEEALNTLDELGALRILNSAPGVQILVDASQLEALKAIAAGTSSPAELHELYED